MPDIKLEDLTASLLAASAHFNAGRHAEAAALADQVRQHLPNSPDALHISGLSRLEMGRTEDALSLLEAAAQAKKSDAGIANSLALARLALGQIDEAAKGLESLARKGKLPAEGLNTLGDCRLRQGDPVKARACFEKALKLNPALDAARVNLGEAFKESGDLQGAIAHYKKVTQTHPLLTSAWRNLGLALQEAEQFSDSILALQHYLKMNPADIPSRLSLGVSHMDHLEFEEALALFDQGIELSPRHAEAWNNRGMALRKLDRTDEAAIAFKTALDCDPSQVSTHYNLAHMLHETRGVEAALAIFDQQVTSSPDDLLAHMGRGHTLLIEGRIAEGWEDYRWRFQQPPKFSGRRDHPFPHWDGSDLSNKTILVWGEQGIGDELLYASLVGDLITRAQHVVIECESRLVPLFERSFPQTTVLARGASKNPSLANLGIELQIAAGDVCQFLRPNLEAFPKGAPYLLCDPDQHTRLRTIYQSEGSKKPLVGLAWHSGRDQVGWQKTIPLKFWEPILRRSDVTFVSLQYGDHEQEIQGANAAFGCNIISDPAVDSLKNMESFAAQVAAMDLVISNSNTAAHMAGALGIPAWSLIPREGSGGLLWYWFNTGSQSMWYDSMTVYRQTSWRDWSDLINRVATDLNAFLARL
jgi:tetratricopeptide (TPR) repeat protein